MTILTIAGIYIFGIITGIITVFIIILCYTYSDGTIIIQHHKSEKKKPLAQMSQKQKLQWRSYVKDKL